MWLIFLRIRRQAKLFVHFSENGLQDSYVETIITKN